MVGAKLRPFGLRWGYDMEQKQMNWKVYSPATGEEIAHLKETSLDEIPILYQHSQQAFQSWSKLSILQRIVYIKKLRLVIVGKMDELVEMISKDTGKVKTEAIMADIMPTLDALRHIEKYAVRALTRQRVKTPLLLFGKKSYIEYMPRGTVLVISPWNYPFQLTIIPIVSAVIGGNTVIAKPSEVTPLVGKMMENLFSEAGFPKGVIQFAHGGKELGSGLTNEKPDYIFFTGSVRTGKMIAESAAKHLIPTTLELGGKDPMIVFQDANLERAVHAAIWGAFTNSGQVCMSVERLYVERPIYEQFLSMLKEQVALLRQGIHVNDDIGSMTYPAQLDIVADHIQDALLKGARLETGTLPEEWVHEGTYFLEPMILSHVNHSMKVMKEESFGPMLPIAPFDSEEEVIRLANDSEYGLNASIWTNDEHKANRVARQLVTGAVNINDVLVSVANHHLPFGGTKLSGIGRYHGKNGLRIFCHEKALLFDPGKRNTEIQWYPYKGKYPYFLSLFQQFFTEQPNWLSIAKLYRKLLKLSMGKKHK